MEKQAVYCRNEVNYVLVMIIYLKPSKQGMQKTFSVVNDLCKASTFFFLSFDCPTVQWSCWFCLAVHVVLS